jgi:sugar-specific transcriptional regulator TrmB
MSKHILVTKLRQIGLSENEAVVYLAALEAGTASASAIAVAADMNRVSTYSILKRLLQQGMVSTQREKGVQYFTALPPEVLVQDARQKARELSESLPLLQFLKKGDNRRVNVEFFEGIEGIKKAYLESLNATTEICNYADSKNIRQHWPEYDKNYVAQRAKKKIFLRGLTKNDAYGKKVQREDNKYYRKMRFIDKKYFQIENEVKIFDDKMLIVSFQPTPFAVIIESEAVADTQRQIFELAWSFAGSSK